MVSLSAAEKRGGGGGGGGGGGLLGSLGLNGLQVLNFLHKN